MTNEIFRIFLKVAEYGSISKASESLYISQPALSQKLKNLEEELDCELFIRSNKGIELTEYGKIVRQYFLASEEIIEEMKKEIESRKNNILNIRIAATPTICNYSLPCVVYHLKQHYPNLQVELYSRNDSSVIGHEIINGRCDIGFISESIEYSKVLESKEVYREKIVLVGGTVDDKYPDFIDVEDLKRYDLMKISTDEDITKIISKNIDGVENLKFTYNLESIDAIKSCIINGYGLAFLPYSVIKKELYHKEVKIINIENIEMFQNVCLIKRNDNTAGLEKVIQYTRRHISEFIC